MAISVVRVGEQERGIASCLAMTKSSCHRERSVAISVVRAGEQKREIASCLAMAKSSCHREQSLAISVVRVGEKKREIASCLAMTHKRRFAGSQIILSSRAQRGDLGCSCW